MKRLVWLGLVISISSLTFATPISVFASSTNSSVAQTKETSNGLPEMIFAGNFSEGLAPVRIGKKFGFINKAGAIVIQPEFDWAKEFSEGVALVRIGGIEEEEQKYGFIDRTGKFAIPPIFDHAEDFSEGLAFVLQEPDCPGNTVDSRSNKEGFIDKTGKVILSVKYDRDSDIRWGLGCNPDFTPPPSNDAVSQLLK